MESSSAQLTRRAEISGLKLSEATEGVAEGVHEEVVVRDCFLNQLLREEHFVRMQHRMGSVLISLNRVKCSKAGSDQYHNRLTSVGHVHLLNREKTLVCFQRPTREFFLDDCEMISDLVKPMDEFSMVLGGVNLVSELRESALNRFKRFGGRNAQERRTITRRYKIKVNRHESSHLQFEVRGD